MKTLLVILIVTISFLLNTYHTTTTTKSNHKITFVSGYWKVHNKHDNKFNDWFKNTLNVNENYVIYTRNEDLSLLKENREKFKNKTIYEIKDIDSFYLNYP